MQHFSAVVLFWPPRPLLVLQNDHGAQIWPLIWNQWPKEPMWPKFQGMVVSQFWNLLRKSASSRAALRFALQLKRRETFSCGQIYYCLAFWMKRKCCSNKNPYLARRWLKAKETLQMCLRRKKWLTGWQTDRKLSERELLWGHLLNLLIGEGHYVTHSKYLEELQSG